MTIGYAICGSFCTHKKALEILKKFADTGAEILPVLSENSYSKSTRFGKAEDFVREIEQITKKNIIYTIEESEPLGPSRNLDIMIIAPCTGNTLAKMASGITDSYVTIL